MYTPPNIMHLYGVQHRTHSNDTDESPKKNTPIRIVVGRKRVLLTLGAAAPGADSILPIGKP